MCKLLPWKVPGLGGDGVVVIVAVFGSGWWEGIVGWEARAVGASSTYAAGAVPGGSSWLFQGPFARMGLVFAGLDEGLGGSFCVEGADGCGGSLDPLFRESLG